MAKTRIPTVAAACTNAAQIIAVEQSTFFSLRPRVLCPRITSAQRNGPCAKLPSCSPQPGAMPEGLNLVRARLWVSSDEARSFHRGPGCSDLFHSGQQPPRVAPGRFPVSGVAGKRRLGRPVSSTVEVLGIYLRVQFRLIAASGIRTASQFHQHADVVNFRAPFVRGVSFAYSVWPLIASSQKATRRR